MAGFSALGSPTQHQLYVGKSELKEREISDKRNGATRTVDGVSMIHRALSRVLIAPTVKNGKIHLSNY